MLHNIGRGGEGMKNSGNKGEEMRSYSTVNTGTSAQEMYETASRDAGHRARELRRLGYRVSVGSLGPQVTSVGRIAMTLVSIHPGTNADTYGLPEVQSERL